MEAVRRELLGRNILANMAGGSSFRQEVPDQVVHVLLCLGDMGTLVQQRSKIGVLVVVRTA
jgi:hypothetical protein